MDTQIPERPLRERQLAEADELDAKAKQARGLAASANTKAETEEGNADKARQAAEHYEKEAGKARDAQESCSGLAAGHRAEQRAAASVAERAEQEAAEIRTRFGIDLSKIGDEHMLTSSPIHDRLAASHGPSTTSPFVPIDGRTGGRQ